MERSGAQAQGPSLGSRAGLGDGPTAGLRCPMQLFSALVLVQEYAGNLLVTHLCGFHIELRVAVGLCPMHCSLSFSFTFKCLIHLEWYHKKSPTNATGESR